jgi:hypothetical protein
MTAIAAKAGAAMIVHAALNIEAVDARDREFGT